MKKHHSNIPPFQYSNRLIVEQGGAKFIFIGILIAALFLLENAPAHGGKAYPDLFECFDKGLQNRLEDVLYEQAFMGAVKHRKLSIALANITDTKRPKLAAVNGDLMMYAASLPKIAILLAVFKQIEKGRMELDDETRSTLRDMIRFSSNRAASRMLRLVGPERVAEILQSPSYRLYDPETNGGLWCGKEYGKNKAWKRDPLHSFSHGATALQAARFYYLLETQQLVSPELTREMKAIMVNPGVKHKFVKGLKGLPGLTIYRKSGTWKSWHADSVMVQSGHHRYIAVALANHPKGGKWMETIIAPLHFLVTSVHPGTHRR